MARAQEVDVTGEPGYRKRIRAWILYDVANSAFATTILAAVFPVYYASVAGANLPTAANATQYYSLTLSISVVFLAVASPVFGTYADVSAAKKRLLVMSAVIGITATALLFFVGEGDWLMASVVFAVARMGFGAANVFYDALLPHVALRRDIDRVSAQGFAFGYLGGGVLLAVNVVMILVLPGDLGTRVAMLSVAVWWAAFSIPLLRHVNDPPPSAVLAPGESPWGVTLRRLRHTLVDLRSAVDLRRFLVGYLVYNDAIGTVIALAAIYASELGIGNIDVILALLLVQLSGMGFSLLFGRLPERGRARQPTVTAFLIGTMVALPLVGISARQALPATVSGLAPQPFEATDDRAGQGILGAAALDVSAGNWTQAPVAPELLENAPARTDGETVRGRATTGRGALELDFTGQEVEITYTLQPGGGTLVALLDGGPASAADGEGAVQDTDAPSRRLDATLTVAAAAAGEHTLRLEADGGPIEISTVEVLPPARHSNLGAIFGLLVATVAVVGAFAVTVGRRILAPIAARLDTRRSIMLALWAYTMVALWGFLLDSVVEFWFLALAVGTVQGGSQALSRSLYARIIPETMSGEFFGFFSILEKFASVLSPLVFVASVALFTSSRPAVLTLALFFIFGIWMLSRVDVDRGQRLADARDAEIRRRVATATIRGER